MARSKLQNWSDRLPANALTDTTGKGLKAADPRCHEAVVRSIKEGLPLALIAKLFCISEHLVLGISRAENIEQDKVKSLADKFEVAAQLSIDAYIHAVKEGKANVDRLPVNAAISVDKMSELRSKGQARSAQVKQDQTMEALNDIVKAAIEKAGKRTQVIEAEVIEEKDSQA
jgi:hypothetical protein